MGLLGIIFSILVAMFLGVHEERIKKGSLGFNGLLVGLSINLYHNVDFTLIFILFAAIVLLVFLTIALEYAFSYFLGLPILSIPFVIVSVVVYFSFYDYNGLNFRTTNHDFPYDPLFPVINPMIESKNAIRLDANSIKAKHNPAQGLD